MPALIDEAELVRRVQRGDKRAFEMLYRNHVGRIYGLCLRMTASVQQAEDCVQETMIRAWKNIDHFRGNSQLSTWLHRIAVNEVLSLRRKQSRYSATTEISDDYFADNSAANDALQIDLEQAIKKLPEGARDAFVLHNIYGYSHKDTSSMLGIAEGSSKAQTHRARQLLKARLT